MKIRLSAVSLLLVLTIQSCQVSVKTGNEVRIDEAIKDFANSNKIGVKYEFVKNKNLVLEIKSNPNNEFLFGKYLLEIRDILAKEYIQFKSIKITDTNNKKYYLKVDEIGFEKIEKLKIKSIEYIEILKRDKEYFYNLLSNDIKKDASYQEFLQLLSANLDSNYSSFGGFAFSEIDKNQNYLYLRWENKSEAIMVCLNYNLNDSIVYGLQFEK